MQKQPPLPQQSDLKPGDVLLYSPSSFFGKLIRAKTWHNISHVEVYRGGGQSAASRDGKGVDSYPLRLDGLAFVLRPVGPFDVAKADLYLDSTKGLAYGWLDLLRFEDIPIHHAGIVCSPFATYYLREGGINIFPTEKPEEVAPFEFLLAVPTCLSLFWPGALANV